MAEIGSGNVPDFPTALDTDTTKEVASPNVGKTKITAAGDNDRAAAAIAAQTEIGIRGAATQNVRDTFNTEHTAAGLHTTAAPANVTKAAASAGTGTTVSRADHKHDVTTANVSNVTKAAAAEGTATSLARSDHKHDVTTAVPVDVGTANAEGTSTSLARADHVHDIAVGSIPALSVGTGALKTATGVATGAPADFTLNDYSFAPSIVTTKNPPPGAGAGNHVTGIGFITDPGNTITRFSMDQALAASGNTVRWRYITASDNPTVWVSYDATGKILATWMSDDPTPDGSPGVVGYDSTGNIAQKTLLVPRADLGKLITGIPAAKIALGKKKSTTVDKEPFRIMWEAFKNPADELMKRGKIIGGKLEAR